MKKKKALTFQNLVNMKYVDMPFEGPWKNALGTPLIKGSWLIWGHSGSGKTSFTVQLAKYLTQFGKVAFDSLEEGTSKSLQQAFIRDNSKFNQRKLLILDTELYDDLVARLSNRRSPDIIIIDSFQYLGINFAEYQYLTKRFKNKLFIFISHADGKMPEGRVAKRVRFDAFIKIWIEGFKAFPAGRYGGGEPFVIWPEGAEKYWKGTTK